jgi:hypothetical protein
MGEKLTGGNNKQLRSAFAADPYGVSRQSSSLCFYFTSELLQRARRHGRWLFPQRVWRQAFCGKVQQ